MPDSVAWKIGGDQGEGIDSTGDVLSSVANRMGYYVYGYKSFSSRIKGGHTHYKVRIASRPVRSAIQETHMLIALNQETIDKNGHEVVAGGVILADESFKPHLQDGMEGTLVALPMAKTARSLGSPLVRNMVALGASAYLLGLPLQAFKDFAAARFGSKGEKVVNQNLEALQSGHDYVAANHGKKLPWSLPEGDGRARMVMSGNEAIALGAVAAGCRVMAGYPITPASDVMENLVKLLPKVGGVVAQMEDEMASITLAVGASYAGARAMTATSGPGISLMQEGIGLAASAEIPVVVVDCQRAGPSTGMPTKNEQSDILALAFGGHGEAPRILLAPGTLEEAFSDMMLAFNLTERYQTPVIVASDLSLSQWRQTVEDLDRKAVPIDRGAVADKEALLALGESVFERYAPTDSGISPRSLPGQKFGQYLATGVEHNRFGKVSEDSKNRKDMMDKRFRKMEPLADERGGTLYAGPEAPEALVISFGSTCGAIDEALEAFSLPGVSVGHLRVRRLWPFPKNEVAAYLKKASRVLVVEQNATAQLRQFMTLVGLGHPQMRSLLKYDGGLFVPDEIAQALSRMMTAEEVAH